MLQEPKSDVTFSRPLRLSPQRRLPAGVDLSAALHDRRGGRAAGELARTMAAHQASLGMARAARLSQVGSPAPGCRDRLLLGDGPSGACHQRAAIQATTVPF